MEQDQPSLLLDRVPAHVLREVFGFLGDSDLARAEATCATFRQASRSESLWRDKLANKLADQAKIVLPETLPHEKCVRTRRRLRLHRISSLLFWPPRQRASRSRRALTSSSSRAQVQPRRNPGGARLEDHV